MCSQAERAYCRLWSELLCLGWPSSSWCVSVAVEGNVQSPHCCVEELGWVLAAEDRAGEKSHSVLSGINLLHRRCAAGRALVSPDDLLFLIASIDAETIHSDQALEEPVDDIPCM